MTTPQQPLEIILPATATRGPRPAFLNPYTGKYTTSRSYALRMQSGFRRGLTQNQARRGIQSVARESETARRRRLSLSAYGQTPWQRFNLSFEQRYGFSYSWWRYLWRKYIREINEMASPDGQITPFHIQQQRANMEITGHDDAWLEARLGEKLHDMKEYRAGNPEDGRYNFIHRDGMEPIEFWWYH